MNNFFLRLVSLTLFFLSIAEGTLAQQTSIPTQTCRFRLAGSMIDPTENLSYLHASKWRAELTKSLQGAPRSVASPMIWTDSETTLERCIQAAQQFSEHFYKVVDTNVRDYTDKWRYISIRPDTVEFEFEDKFVSVVGEVRSSDFSVPISKCIRPDLASSLPSTFWAKLEQIRNDSTCESSSFSFVDQVSLKEKQVVSFRVTGEVKPVYELTDR